MAAKPGRLQTALLDEKIEIKSMMRNKGLLQGKISPAA